MDKNPFGEELYRRVDRFVEPHGTLTANLWWLSMFIGAAQTREQWQAVSKDVDDVERACQQFVVYCRELVSEKLAALD